MNRSNQLRLLWTVCAMTFFLGFEAGGFQLMLLRIAKDFALSDTFMGMLATAQYIPIIALPLLAGGLADRTSKKAVLMVFGALFAGGCLLVAASPSPLLFILAILVVGAGYSVCESVSSAAVADASGPLADKRLNLVQGCFSLGAVAGPLAADALAEKTMLGWRGPFLLCALAYLPLLALLLSIRLQPAAQASQPLQLRQVFKPGFTVFFIAILLYVGIENGAAFFMDSLFVRRLDAPGSSALALSFFWLSMAISRLLYGLLRSRHHRTLQICFIGVAVLLAALAFVHRPPSALLACCGAGLLCGPIWPILMASAVREHPEHTGKATGIMSSGCGIGAGLSPMLMGWMMNYFGVGGAFLSLSIVAVCGAACISLGVKTRRVQNDNR